MEKKRIEGRDALPWTDAQLVKMLEEALDATFGNRFLAHHLSKAAIERWFAFELAANLDNHLREHGWVALIEPHRIDILLAPLNSVELEERLHTGAKWPRPCVALELKAAVLADNPTSNSGYCRTLMHDLVQKPKQEMEKNRTCTRRLGILLTTDATWSNSKHAVQSKQRGDELERSQLVLMPPLNVTGGSRRGKPIKYETSLGIFSGRVWGQIVDVE